MALRRGLVSLERRSTCCALTAACTSEPAPDATSSPTPVSTTPTESQIERQIRLDYEAAEQAYRANMAEQDRLVRGWWSDESNSCTQSNCDWLLPENHCPSRSMKSARRAGTRRNYQDRSASFMISGWKTGRVRLISCEDNSRLGFVDDRARTSPQKAARATSRLLTVVQSSAVVGRFLRLLQRRLETFEGQPCAA